MREETENTENIISHIENLIYKINNATPNQMTITELSEIVHKERIREKTSTNESKLYSRDLGLVINSELSHLVNSRKNPKNRLDELIEFRTTIIPIMKRKISDLKNG